MKMGQEISSKLHQYAKKKAQQICHEKGQYIASDLGQFNGVNAKAETDSIIISAPSLSAKLDENPLMRWTIKK
ncbi:hypothetical protein LPB140_11100 [Sphingorhabdus lutea]|uniref:Uncharacterized protein n=1 Tax=Sphingorhabdus lutea TaxID=1913578 RepID=A0A1L3JDN8_9SPHN|nr:hypothetical protein [Sphingorhabdus lutea]APG63242.1 hypothetical protein LPB140_11100 [Sphingorhabdus lutea]